ncbi:MAG: hypothetical protein AAFO95_00575 [Cyanobacteria bacterium J06600_6]
MNFTITEIKPAATTLEVLTLHGIELDLESILEAEIAAGVANDASNMI